MQVSLEISSVLFAQASVVLLNQAVDMWEHACGVDDMHMQMQRRAKGGLERKGQK